MYLKTKKIRMGAKKDERQGYAECWTTASPKLTVQFCDEVDRLRAEVEALRAMLKRVQFAEQMHGSVGEVCMVCGGEHEHAPDCELAKLLQ